MGRKQTNGKAEEMPASRRAWLTQQFVEALARDFEENGIAVIEKLRTSHPKDYARLVADLVPKVQTSDAADQFNFRSVDSLDQLVEKLARDISDWGLADRFISLLNKDNKDQHLS